jgi:hypothetical protein
MGFIALLPKKRIDRLPINDAKAFKRFLGLRALGLSGQEYTAPFRIRETTPGGLFGPEVGIIGVLRHQVVER